MTTAALARSLGCSDQTLYRLVARGILDPAGERGSGSQFTWTPDEQRAAAALVMFMRSHLMERGLSPSAKVARDDCLRSIAEAARAELPEQLVPRWLILLGDGSCVRGDDWLAASMGEHRTLIPLDRNPAEGLALAGQRP